MTEPLRALRGSFLWCVADPGLTPDPARQTAALRWIGDGLMLIRNGRIAEIGPAADLLPRLGPDIPVDDHTGRLILPGFIDGHVHFPQIDVIGSYGEQLLQWLERYTFPAEQRYADPAYAAEAARIFCASLLAEGTTTAAVYCTVHTASVDAFMTEARRRNLRMIAGKILMDRNAPPALCDTPASADRDSRDLIARWHGVDRLSYALTPRFAPTSTPAQLAVCSKIADDFPDIYIQTHVAENRQEVAWVRDLFPDARSYLDVYDRCGLLRDRAIYGHCIWLDDTDRDRMAASGAAAAFCPSSNLFLGSGLYDIRVPHRVALGSDVGGGTHLSMLRTLGDGYKVQQLQGISLSPAAALYLATLGSARALCLGDRIGSLEIGKEADLVVLDPESTAMLRRRHDRASLSAGGLEEALSMFFLMMTLGEGVAGVYVLGDFIRRTG